ncbi:MAG: uncharacterized protein KVP18_004822, partial [Porospora cf. gigantea A]
MEVEGKDADGKYGKYGFPIYLDERFTFEAQWPNAPEYNPTGVWIKDFDVPASWAGKQIFLNVGGARSSLTVFCNGEEVGYSQGAKLAAEFDLTTYLEVGKVNRLTFLIIRYSDASYLEKQDMIDLSGLERDVFLYTTGKQRVTDFTVKYQLTPDTFKDAESTSVTLTLTNYDQAWPADLKVKVWNTISGDTAEVVSQDLTVTPIVDSSTVDVSVTLGKVADVALWSAEKPDLYDLHIQTFVGGVSVEHLQHHLGYRHVEISKSGPMKGQLL